MKRKKNKEEEEKLNYRCSRWSWRENKE